MLLLILNKKPSLMSPHQNETKRWQRVGGGSLRRVGSGRNRNAPPRFGFAVVVRDLLRGKNILSYKSYWPASETQSKKTQ